MGKWLEPKCKVFGKKSRKKWGTLDWNYVYWSKGHNVVIISQYFASSLKTRSAPIIISNFLNLFHNRGANVMSMISILLESIHP